ncbi:MAG: phosphoglucosamine mutase [Planctomycetes bacterium]|nr:phosphoglucosamine mutase [Planctomycetota bacterium]
MKEPIISVSGLRGIVGESLTPENATRYCAAFASLLPPGGVVLGRDGRTTGRMLLDAVSAGLRAVGRHVIDADIAATPTVGVLVRHVGAAGGIQVSASHNPAEYNGLKLFNGEGRVIPKPEGMQVIDRYRSGSPAWVPWQQVGRAATVVAAADAHLHTILATVDVERIKRRKFRVLLDANRGSGSLLGRALLEALDCELTVLGEPADGQFEHPAEPTEENLAGVLQSVRTAKAEVGFCQDPDADRLAVIDAAGRYLGEEKTLAMCVDHVLGQTPGPIVTNCSTSRMAEDLATKYGVPFFRSAVGEANVVDLMCEHEAVLGGEGNGGVIDPRVVLVRDSFVGMALLLDAMAAREATIAQLADELPRYEIHKTKASVADGKLPAALAALERHFADATVDKLDGLRFDWPGRWLLVRGSNTEPIVRAIAEAQTAAAAQQLCDAALAALKPFAG